LQREEPEHIDMVGPVEQEDGERGEQAEAAGLVPVGEQEEEGANTLLGVASADVKEEHAAVAAEQLSVQPQEHPEDGLQLAEPKERQEEMDQTDQQHEQPVAALEAGAEEEGAGVMKCETQVFLASSAQAEAGMQVATQVLVPMEATSVEFSTQVLPEAAIQVLAPTQAAGAVATKAGETPKFITRAEIKRPKSALQLFSEEVRSQVIEEIGTKKAILVTTAIAARWKSLDPVAKENYISLARDLKQKFDADIAQGATVAMSIKKARLVAKLGKGKGAAAKAKARRLRTTRSVEQLKRRAGPKKPKCSYSIWLGENRKKVRAGLVADGVADPSFEEIARAAGKTWLALTEEQKAPFVERAKVLSLKFKDINKACKEYKKANTKDLTARAKAEAKKKAKQAAQKKKEASKKAAPVGASAKTASDTPQKRTASEGAIKPTPSKAKKGVPQKAVYFDMGLLAEAEKAGLAGTFRRLVERDDMKPYSQRVLLNALVANEGLLHRAKDWVLARQK